MKRSQLRYYGVAVGVVLLALLLTLLLQSSLSLSIFAFFHAAVAISSWYGGIKPGLLTAALSALISLYFFLPPIHSLAITSLSTLLQLGVFVLVTLVISSLNSELRTAKQRLEVSLRKLQASEERYRRFIDTAYEGVWTTNVEGRIEYVNQRMAEMLGYSENEILGRPLFDFMDYETCLEVEPHLHRRQQGIKEQFNLRYRRKDGSALWAIVSASPILDEQGTFCGEIAMITDVSDRKAVEEALRKNEQLFRLAIDNFPDTFAIYDANRRIQFVNARGIELTGKSLEEFLGHTDEEIWSNQVTDSYLPLLQRTIETRTLQSQECQITLPDIGQFTMIVKYVPLLDERGEIYSILGITYDITERKQAEEALLESEARFRSVVESQMIGIGFWEGDGYITDANDALLEMIGYTRDEFLSGTIRWQDLTPPEYYRLDEKAFAQTQAMGFCTPYEKEYIRKDGSRFPIMLGGGHFRGYNDKGSFFVLDITERKQVEAALRESEERFRHMADTAPVLIWMSGVDKLCNYFNKPWLDFTGRTMEQELGNGWAQGVHPDDFQRCLNTYTTAFDAREEFKMEYRLRRFDGEYRWIFDSGVPRFTPEGSFLGYIGSCIDISDRKLAEAEIRQLNDSLEQRVRERTAQLEAANQALEAFSYSVSHDLRAPFRHVSGFVDLLEKRAAPSLDETSLRYLKLIGQAAKNAGKLIDDLLAFSRIGRTQMRHTTVNMNQLVQEVRRDIELETKGRAINWQIEELPQVCGDASLLQLVFSNLIGNAVKYTQTRTQAEIEIGTHSDESEEVVFFVRDNGVGFDMRYVHKLFGVFQRLHSAEQFEGTGIGLANVGRIIHRHGGRTWAEGAIDNGATFYFSLPKLVQKEDNAGIKAHSAS